MKGSAKVRRYRIGRVRIRTERRFQPPSYPLTSCFLRLRIGTWEVWIEWGEKFTRL